MLGHYAPPPPGNFVNVSNILINTFLFILAIKCTIDKFNQNVATDLLKLNKEK